MTTTTRSETPARNAKRVRIDEDENEVEIIRVEKGKATPSIGARNYVEAAVASHPEAIQRVVLAVAKDFLSLKAQLRQKLITQDKLDNDADFVPRSARVAFKLTAPPSIMETDDFKSLASAMDETTKLYSIECKKAIASVAKLVNENLKDQIKELFKKGLLQFCTLFYIQQKPLAKDSVPSRKIGLYVLNAMEPSSLQGTFVNKTKLHEELKRELDDDTNTVAATPITYTAAEQTVFDTIKPNIIALMHLVFVDSISKFESIFHEQETTKSLEKQAKEFLVGDATTATAMEIDQEPSATPALLREMVNEAVQSKTAKLHSELQKLRDGTKRSAAKNDSRGAPSSSTTKGASSKNKNKKGKGKEKESKNKMEKEQNPDKAPNKPNPKQQKQKQRGNSVEPKGNDSVASNKKNKKPSGQKSKNRKRGTTNSPRNRF